MLKNTFAHIPGIGNKSEQQIWASGITSWDNLIDSDEFKLSPKRIETLIQYTQDSIKNMNDNNPCHFADLLPANMHWRLFPEFRDSIVYLDIETTGLDMFGFEITTIALYDGKSIHYYVQGQNLNDFIADIERYNVIVSYNGKTFDIPFIENFFRIKLNHAHIDLRYILKSLGYSGGLKRCEKALGIDRGDLDGVDGYFGILLWNDYQQNRNPKALETLLAYNIEDVVNLETLMVMAYNMKIQDTPFVKSHHIPEPIRPEIPFAVDIETVERIKRGIFSNTEFDFF